MNLADPELELIDPTPNIYNLFVHFDQLFFHSQLDGRALVRWSKRMYSCAGICGYEGRNGICDIALSEPLLKLRPRKDLIETLLHEMIHAYLFITDRDKDRDGHGPIFQAHMHRINRKAGLNISIYHNFHEEVALYLKHWWRCNGMCQRMKPHFGVFRRSSNRAPGPHDCWWEYHKNRCGGKFIKIKEPPLLKPTRKNCQGKINAHITKYIVTNNNNNTVNKNVSMQKKVGNAVKSIPNNKITPTTPPPNTGNLMKQTDSKRRNSSSVKNTVRDVWKNKQISAVEQIQAPENYISPTYYYVPTATKHKADSVHTDAPPNKINKMVTLDDYFTKTAVSILKDVYGKEFIVSQSSNNKLKAEEVQDGNGTKMQPVNVVPLTSSCRNGCIHEDLVNCPSCNDKVRSKDINRHLDECLNKGIIEALSEEFVQTPATITKSQTNEVQRNFNDIVGDVPKVTAIKSKTVNKTDLNIPKTEKDYTNDYIISKPSTSRENYVDQICPCCENKVEIPMELHLEECLAFFKNNVTIPEEGSSSTETISIIVDEAVSPKVKVEPGTSKEDNTVPKCACCGDTITKPIEIHLDECLGFFNNDTTLPTEGPSVEIVTINDDDEFDETQTLNVTGTKTPCPCCLKMVEIEEMNDHLDFCL